MATDIIEQLRKETGGEDLDLSWLDKPLAERGLQVKPGKRGLTLEDISTSSYGAACRESGCTTASIASVAAVLPSRASAAASMAPWVCRQHGYALIQLSATAGAAAPSGSA